MRDTIRWRGVKPRIGKFSTDLRNFHNNGIFHINFSSIIAKNDGLFFSLLGLISLYL